MRKFRRTLSAVLTAAMLTSSFLLPVNAQDTELDLGVVNFDAVMKSGAEKENLTKIKNYTEDAISKGDEIILFPEYSLTSKMEDAIDVETNTSVKEIQKMADESDVYVLFGSTIKEENDVYSAMIICDPEGDVDTYKKIHISDEEYKEGYSAGTDPYILATEYGNFGVAMGDEFADTTEIGKYYYGHACRMVLVGQSYGADSDLALSQGEYDLMSTTYAYVRMYGRAVAVANLFTKDDTQTYFGESHICTGYTTGWIAGGNEDKSAPAVTTEAGVQSATIPANKNDAGYGLNGARTNLSADWYGELLDYEMPVYGEGSEYKDDVKVASVNFHPKWGDLEYNVSEIKSLMKDASEDGVELLVFPEMALSAYSVITPDTYGEAEKAKFGEQYMQQALAQTIRGENPSETIVELQELAESYGMYVVIGLPERDEIDPETYWNSVAILGPDLMQSYRKVNLASPEPNWASFGTDNQDGIFETNFGLVGVAICADIYNYQELQRTFAEKGCRIAINCTAGAANFASVENGGWQITYQHRLESFMLRDDTCMITSNLVGYEGPEITGELKESLENAGYTQDDITCAWLYKGNEELYNLLYEYDEETDKYVKLLNPRDCIFPGSSVCMALDDTQALGTKVSGNTSETATIVPYEEAKLNEYFDYDGDGKSPYLNYTPDTFNTYVTADFDLTDTLDNFYDENPYDYRPDLYYQWYSEIFYNANEIELSEKTLTDEATKVSLTAKMPANTQMTVNFDQARTIGNETKLLIGLTSEITTDVLHTNTTNALYGATTRKYTGSYLPSFGTIDLAVPVENSDVAVYVNGEAKAVEVKDGVALFSVNDLYELNDITLVSNVEPTVTPEPTTVPTTAPTVAPTKVPSATPETGDNNMLLVFAGLVILSAGALTVVYRKKMN